MVWNCGWDKIFEERPWGRYPPEELVRFISIAFSQKNPSEIKILEVGCGPGANIWYLSREKFCVYGIDGSQVAIAKAKDRLYSENLNAILHVGDVMRLPFEDNFFDAVIDIECIYANTLSDSRIIMNEINRVLKHGGFFFSKTFMVGTYGDGNGERIPGEPHTYRELTESVLKKGYGVIRFSSEEDIKDLYSVFDITKIDHLIQSRNNRKFEVKEWLIECNKKQSPGRALEP